MSDNESRRLESEKDVGRKHRFAKDGITKNKAKKPDENQQRIAKA